MVLLNHVKVYAISLLAAVFALLGSPAQAAVPSLKIAPLKYQEPLELGKPKQGFVDVSNPSDSAVSIRAELQGFRQTGTDGTIEFYDDPNLAKGIIIDAPEFELGAREAARIAFTINPNNLKPGGVYAALFFRTVPQPVSAAGTTISQSARVGTLLILDIGGQGKKEGVVTRVKVPWFSFGREISLSYVYKNTGTSEQAIAFNPAFTAKAGVFTRPKESPTGLVMSGNEREFSHKISGNYVGIIPVTVRDAETGDSKTAYTLGIVGQRAFVSTLVVFFSIILLWWVYRRRRIVKTKK